MDTIPFTNRQRIVKGCVIGIVGLAVLLGSSGVSLAIIYKQGYTYCKCACSGTSNDHVFEFGAQAEGCDFNGTKCQVENLETGKQEYGKLKDCEQCLAENQFELGSCTRAFPAPPSGPGTELSPYGPKQNARPERKPRSPYKQNLPSAPGGLPRQNAPVASTPLSPQQQQRLQQQPMFQQTAPAGMFQQAAPTVRGVEGAPASPAPTEQKATTPAPK